MTIYIRWLRGDTSASLSMTFTREMTEYIKSSLRGIMTEGAQYFVGALRFWGRKRSLLDEGVPAALLGSAPDGAYGEPLF